MQKLGFFIVLVSCCFWSKNAFAQKDFGQCERLVQKHKVEKAIECYEEKLPKNDSNIKLLCRLTELHYENKNLAQTKHYAQQAIAVDANAAYDPLYYLARKMSFRRDNETAVYILDLLGNNTGDKAKREKLGALKGNYLLQKYELNQPRYNVVLDNLGDSINSADAEYLPSLSLDGNTMVFTRRINGANEDFYIAEKDSNGTWLAAKNLGYPPNTGMPDGAAKLSADGNYLFFTRCDMRSPNGIVGGGCDLVFCYRTGRKDGQVIWSAPQYFEFTINTTAYEGQPCLSSDNKDLYFVSDREGGYGGKDIYVSHFENNFWSLPENLGPQINTAKDETTPFIHPDNETLYFASDGHPTIGQADVFVSRKMGNEQWQKVVNLGAPINSADIDGGIAVNAKGTRGYIATERAGSKGKLDIYGFDLYEGIRPIPTLCVKGQVSNKKTKELFKEQKIAFFHYPSLALKNELTANKGDASYTQALHLGKQYLMTVDRPGYRPFYKLLDVRTDTFPDNLYKNIRLREPGIIDTLGSYRLWLDSNNQYTEGALQTLEHIQSNLQAWADDSAAVKLYIETAYYYGDGDTDTIGQLYFSNRSQIANQLRADLHQASVPNEKMILRMKPFIWRDEAAELNYIDLHFVEFY